MRALLLAALVVAWMPGCAGPSSSPPSSAHAFTATLEDGNGHVRDLVLDGPVHVQGRDLQVRSAYQLRDADSRRPEAPFFWYLDATFHVVRKDSTCGDNDCEHYRNALFFVHGALAPYGIGLPLALEADGTLHSHQARDDVPVTTTRHGGTFRLSGSVDLPSGDYGFTGGRLVPDGPEWRVTSYRQGATLAGADAWPMESFVATGKPAPWFAGADSDGFAIGYTHQQLLDGLRASAPAVDQALGAGGCVAGYSLILYGVQQDDPLTEAEARANFVIEQADGQATAYALRAYHDLFGTTQFEVLSQQSATVNVSCPDLLAAGASRLDALAAQGLLQGLAIRQQGPTAFRFQGYDLASLTGRPAAASYQRFTLSWIPGHVDLSGNAGFLDYQATVDPASGWLESITAHPQDLAPAG